VATSGITFGRRATQHSAADIAGSVTPRHILRVLGMRVRNSKRADCPLCKGNSAGTVAFTGRLWHCHRCHEGGDVFSLVRAVNRCDFAAALRFLADLAGIRLADDRGPGSHRELAARKRQRQRLEDGANKLSVLEHALLLESRGLIHDAERTHLKASKRLAALIRGELERFRGEQESLWLTLQAADRVLSAELPTYSLLSFGTPEDRLRFVLRPELRNEIIAGVKWEGYVRTADGKRVEVLA
jgi:CHC2 zinc finger